MLWTPLCVLLFTHPFRIFAQTTGDDIPIVEVSDGRIFLPSAASVAGVCSTITTTIGNTFDYIPVPCADVAHAPIWSEKVLVDGTTAEIIIAPSGNVRFASEAWLDANPPSSTRPASQTRFSTKATASSTASAFSRVVPSSYISLNSSSGVSTSLWGARSNSPPTATQTSLYLSNTSQGSVANNLSISTVSSYQNTSSGSGNRSTSLRTGSSSLKSGATSISANLTWSYHLRVQGPSLTTQSTLFDSDSGTLTSINACSGYSASSVTRLVNLGQNSSSPQLESNPSSSSLLSSLMRSISTSRGSHEPATNAPSAPPTEGFPSTTTSIRIALAATSLTTSSFLSIPTITPRPKSSASATGNFTPPISSDLDAFETSGPSLITLSMSGQSITLTRQTMPGFEDFTGTTTVTTSEMTTNSAGVVVWVTGSVIIGTDGIFWGLYLASLGTRGFCIWPFCSGGGICIWPFCGGTGGGGGGGHDGIPKDEGKKTLPDPKTQEGMTRKRSDPTSTTVPTSTTAPKSTLPKSTTATTTASDTACPLFSIPTDSLTFDDSPTWNPNDPEYVGDIVTAAYAIWRIDTGSGSEILPPLPTNTGYGNAVSIDFIPNVASGGGSSTNGPSSTATTTPMSGVSNSAVVAASAALMASIMSASSASVALVQSVESVQSAASVESVAAAQSVALVEIFAAIQSQASSNSIASAQSVASVSKSSVLSVASAASAQSVASASKSSVLSVASAISAASVASVLSAASIASLPTPTPNLAILIMRNVNCDDTNCASDGYVYDVVPSSPTVLICSNPPYIHYYSYPDDAPDDVQFYAINSGTFTSHGVYTNCQYHGTSISFGIFGCDQMEALFCSLPTEQETSCSSTHDIYEDEWEPVAYCEWVGTTPQSKRRFSRYSM